MKLKIRHNFEWDTDGLAPYIDQENEQLEVRMVAQARSVRLMRVQEGVKGTQDIQQLTTSVTLQNGATCGFNPIGTAKVSPRQITASDAKIELSFCNKDIVGFWPERKLARGSAGELESLPFEAEITDNILKNHAIVIDKLIWQGDTDSLDPNLNRIDGFLTLFAADANIVALNTSGATTFTKDNILELIRDGIDAMPEEISSQPNFGAFAGWETMRKIMNAIGEGNLFHYKVEELIEGDKQLIAIEVPGTLVKVYYVPGLSGTDTFVMGLIGSNGDFVVATDTESEFTTFKMWFNEDEEELRLRMRYRIGVNYPFSEQIGWFELAAS